MRFVIQARSHVGCRRPDNQDLAAVGGVLVRDGTHAREFEQGPGDRPLLVAIADGMGGHAGGAHASALVLERLRDAVAMWAPDCSGAELAAGLERALLDAHRACAEAGRIDHALAGMGTTCTALVLGANGAALAHVGDSRLYRLRDRILAQLTRDHAALVPGGDGMPRHVLTNAIGGGDVAIDLDDFTGRMLPEDVYLLCTDGLHGEVDEAALRAALAAPAADPTEALVDLALATGAPDNVTVVRIAAVA